MWLWQGSGLFGFLDRMELRNLKVDASTPRECHRQIPSTMIIARRQLRSANLTYDISGCMLCQWRSFSISYRRLDEKKPAKSSPPASAPASVIPKNSTPPTVPESPLQDAPRAYGKAHSKFDPKPLNRPIGLPKPPQAGENTGIDSRTWKQRRDDFVNYDKHLERRKQLYGFSRSYQFHRLAANVK